MTSDKFTIGMDIGGTHIRAVIVDKSGTVIKSLLEKTGSRRSPGDICTQINESIDTLCHKSSTKRNCLHAIGIGIAAWINKRNGFIPVAPNLGWNDVSFGDILSKAVPEPACVINDLSAITYGEWKLGTGLGFSDILCVFVGSGLGCGLILDSKLYEGSMGYAAELGHITVRKNGRKCGCGQRGCLEAYVGGNYLAKGSNKTDRDSIAKYLASGISTAVKILNPECIILGGGMIKGNPSTFDETREILLKITPEPFAKNITFQKPLLGEMAGAIGAALIALKRL